MRTRFRGRTTPPISAFAAVHSSRQRPTLC